MVDLFITTKEAAEILGFRDYTQLRHFIYRNKEFFQSEKMSGSKGVFYRKSKIVALLDNQKFLSIKKGGDFSRKSIVIREMSAFNQLAFSFLMILNKNKEVSK